MLVLQYFETSQVVTQCFWTFHYCSIFDPIFRVPQNVSFFFKLSRSILLSTHDDTLTNVSDIMNISACAFIAAPFVQYASLEPYNRNVLRQVSAEAILYYNPYCPTLPLVLRPSLCYCNSPYCRAVFPVTPHTLLYISCTTVLMELKSASCHCPYHTTVPLVRQRLLYYILSCTKVPLVRQTILYNRPSCTVANFVQQSLLYYILSCTAIEFVQQSLLYNITYCTAAAFCTTVPLVLHRVLYNSPSCTTFSLVQQLILYNSPSCTTLPIVLQPLFVQQSLLYCIVFCTTVPLILQRVCTTVPLIRQRVLYYSRPTSYTAAAFVLQSLLYGNGFCTTVPLKRQRVLYYSTSYTATVFVLQSLLYGNGFYNNNNKFNYIAPYI